MNPVILALCGEHGIDSDSVEVLEDVTKPASKSAQTKFLKSCAKKNIFIVTTDVKVSDWLYGEGWGARGTADATYLYNGA